MVWSKDKELSKTDKSVRDNDIWKISNKQVVKCILSSNTDTYQHILEGSSVKQLGTRFLSNTGVFKPSVPPIM